MSNTATAQDETEDRYFTQVDEGDVRLFTLDQLDAAFNAGLIHENTYLCLEGDSKWLTLAEVAGLGDEEPVSAPHLIASAAPVSQAAQVSQVVQSAAYRAPASVAPAYADHGPYGAPIVNSFAPVAMPRSIAPVSSDLDDDMEMFARRKRPLGKIIAAVAVLGLAGVGFAVVQSGGLRLPKLKVDDSVAQASAASLSLSKVEAKPTPVAEVAKPEPPKAEEPKPAEPAADAAATTDGAKKTDDKFSEEMKAALLNKDKQTAGKKGAKKPARAAVAARAKAGKPAKAGGGGGGFKAGGSAYDPLNGKL
jgi:hypothetical protein